MRTTERRRNLQLGRSGHGVSPHVTLAVPAEVLDSLRDAAKANDTTLSEYVRQALYRGLDVCARQDRRGDKS